MKYDIEKIYAIQRTWLTPNWIPGKEFNQKVVDDINYLIGVIHELNLRIAEVSNHVHFKGD